MKMKYLLILLFIFPIVNAFSEQDSTTNKAIVQPTQSKDTVSFNEARAYKMLYENQVESNNLILNTIFYALGGLGAAILFVFASNWWFNDKKVKELISEIDTKVQSVKDKTYSELSEKINSLSIEKIGEINSFQNKVKADITSNISNLTKQFKDFSDDLTKQIKLDNKDLLGNYQKQLDSFNANYSQQISTLNENLKSTTSSLKENIEDKEQYLKELINSENKSRLSEIQNLEEKVLRNEAWMWEGRNVPNNTLSTQLEELDLKIISNTDLTFYLDCILETSKKLNWLLDLDKDNIRKQLLKVPEKYNSKVEEILAITDNVKDL